MSLVDQIVTGLAPDAPAETKRSAVLVDAGGDTPSMLEAWFGTRTTDSGRPLTVDQALGLDAVFGCIRIHADTIGMLPIISYEDLGEGNRKRLRRGDRSFSLLHLEPNPEMTAVDAWSMAGAHLNAQGDSFWGKQFERGRLQWLWPIPPERVAVERKRGVKVYRLRSETGVMLDRLYTDDDIIHIKGLSLNGLRGLSPIGLAREAIAAGLAMESYLNRFWANSAMPRGVLEVEGEISDEAAERVRRRWERLYRGSKNAHRVAVLEAGSKFSNISVSMSDLEFVSQQNLTAIKACRIFRVPPSLLYADYTKSSLTYRTVEGENLQFLIHGVQPWLTRIEQALTRDRDVYPNRNHYAEFLADALLRTDSLTRAQVWKIAAGGRAWMKPGTEIRPRENLPADAEMDELPPADTGDTQTAEEKLQTLAGELATENGPEYVERIVDGAIRLGR